MARILVLSVPSAQSLQNKINAIKALRALTGFGLKEAKETIEAVTPISAQTVSVSDSMMEPAYSEALERLRDSGIHVVQVNSNVPSRRAIAEELRRIISYATMASQYDIARALLNVMETFCPEPAEGFRPDEDDHEQI